VKDIFIFSMDESKNKFSSIWNSFQLLCFLIKLFAFTNSILISLIISLLTNLESNKSMEIWWKPIHESFLEWYWGFGGDFTFVIYKAFGKNLQCPKALQVRKEKWNWNMMYKFSISKLLKNNWLSTNYRNVMLVCQKRLQL
jgi:hypothetical protein